MATDNLGPIEWREPPALKQLPRGRGSIWAERLRPLMAAPGTWAMVRKHETPAKAAQNASSLRKSKSVPPGKWEFLSRDMEVFAQYVGPE